jgi:deoxyribodipyrimidine photo-lyase
MKNTNTQDIIKTSVTLFWFRRDLRLEDNAGLYHALKENKKVLPIFIFDTEILTKLEDKADARVEFIHHSLAIIKSELENIGSSLLVLYGNPVDLINQLNPNAVYTNHDYEPYAKQRDNIIKTKLELKGIVFKTYKDQVIFEKDEVAKEDGAPYTIFTPYSKKWKAKVNKFYLDSYPTKEYFKNLKQTSPLPFPELSVIGFTKSGLIFPPRIIKQKIIDLYDKQRNFPAIEGTTRLSVHLRFGTVSIRMLARLAIPTNEVWLNELI